MFTAYVVVLLSQLWMTRLFRSGPKNILTIGNKSD